MREYLRVTPTSGELTATGIPKAIASLHTLRSSEQPGLLQKLNPLHSTLPPRFEFLIISEGPEDPVEFYYGTDEHLDTLEARLRSIYPSSFDIEHVEIDPTTKLIPPAEYSREEFTEAVENDQLLYEFGTDERQTKEVDSSVDGTSVGEDASEQTWVEVGDTLVQVGSPVSRLEPGTQTVVDRPTLTTDGTILARPDVGLLHPLGVRWFGTATRKKDWMTTITPFSEASGNDDEGEVTDLPLATVIDHLNDTEHPIAFQVVFERRGDWTGSAETRMEDLESGMDTTFQRWVGDSLTLYEESSEAPDRLMSESAKKRVSRIRDKTPNRTFHVNLRAVTVPADDGDLKRLESRLNSLQAAFGKVAGSYYSIVGKSLRDSGWRQKTKQKNARTELERLLNRELVTDTGKRRPDLVLNGDELANFILIPPAEQLSIEGARGTRAEQQSRNPLPRPHQDIMQELRDGMAIGYALDENSKPEDVPTTVPPGLLPTHYGRFGTTGAGKSVATINDKLSAYANTDGPVILIDRKGDGMAENYMRAHARRFGMTDLEENVIHFRVPNTLPGFSFFDLEPALENGRNRTDAVQRKADHTEEILRLAMGPDAYDSAKVAPTLIKMLVKLLFDEEYGREHGHYRESTDYFEFRHLHQVIDQLREAGPPQVDLSEAPKSSNEAVTRTIRRQLQQDQQSFTIMMNGVSNRLDPISLDDRLRPVFNNTENNFDFRDHLDENTVILFDLGDLRDEAARLMTGLILTNLEDAIREQSHEIPMYPDDYVVNLIIDEAASVVVSDIMNNLLERGRSFRLSVGLSMQFPEQMEAAGGRKMYLNTLNNIGTLLVGKINVDRELARAMAHEEMSPEDFANRIRSLPRGEWIASLPSPTFGETGPYPFSLDPLPIPAGHPESDAPLTKREEQLFSETLSDIHERATDEYGVPDDAAPTTQTPEELHEVLDIDTDELDVAIAKIVRSVQLREGVREENGWVSVETVDDDLRNLFDDVDTDVPSYDELTTIRQRSRFLENTVNIDADEIVIRLTEAGEKIAEPDTGDVRAAGGSDHDAALLEIEEELTSLGFTVTILSQDGSEKSDAQATHPDLEETFAIEVETTTPEYPVKVLTNFRKAQEAEEVPLFVVRTGNEKTDWAKRVDGILNPPVRELDDGSIQFYTTDSTLTFNGGATKEGGVTAVRPRTESSDTNRSVWVQDDGSLVLRDGAGTEHLRVDSFDAVTKNRVPAIYSYDHASAEYLVHEPGETHTYESKADFEADWARINAPFIPAEELPNPEFGTDAYGIVILPEGGESVVYDSGTTVPIQTLLDTSFAVGQREDSFGMAVQEQTQTTPALPSADDDWKDDADAVTGRFASEYLVEDEGESVTSPVVYELYEEWVKSHNLEPDSKGWFGRRLKKHVDFEPATIRQDGSQVRCYEGLRLRRTEVSDE
ncbi:type IV secretory system conjugative DNA transfer family protein [Haloarchaeobius amylolyticus]|uniref:type IV secretory system conjugative DNA transfer family protein n=1 Tax=Haloarchaeobius amylolyticus TaxID=1198296 RepID=UPI00226D6003|nr:primase-like DNA-binding domain-containing protein [Haloarchaeobius amylolyticus]